MTTDPTPAEKLTGPQRRNLGELAALGRDAFWQPANSGEHRCAARLAALGLLRREFRPHGYVFTADGWRVAQGVCDA